MRIGIDCSTFLNPGHGEGAGVGHYTYFLVKHLLAFDAKNEYVLFFDNRLTAEGVREFTEGKKNVSIRFFPFHIYKKYLLFAYSHLLVASAVSRERLDVFHAPANVFALAYEGATVVTVHDLAIYKHPEWFSGGRSGQSFSTKFLVPQSLKKAKKIIAVSESTKKDIQGIFHTPADKIKVIYEGVEHPNPLDIKEAICGLPHIACREELYRVYPLRDPYILFLGTLEPRKNITTLILGYERVVRNMKRNNMETDVQLVIAGAKGWKYEKIFHEMKRANDQLCNFFRTKKEYISYLGYVLQREKMPLMAHARVFAFPSLYEGFGLPVLEAMSVGTPVLTSRISSLSEVAGEAGVFVDPDDVSCVTRGLYTILTTPREAFEKKGKIQAKRFSWEKAARETLKVYEEVMKT